MVQVVMSEVVGVLRMRVFLSGMPECKVGEMDGGNGGRNAKRIHYAAL